MGKKLSSIISKVSASASIFLLTQTAISAKTPSEWLSGIKFVKQGSDVEGVVFKLVNYMIGAAALLAVIFLVVAGFMYITANGDEQKIGKATKTLTFALVGLIVCFIAVLLVNFVLKQFLGITL